MMNLYIQNENGILMICLAKTRKDAVQSFFQKTVELNDLDEFNTLPNTSLICFDDLNLNDVRVLNDMEMEYIDE